MLRAALLSMSLALVPASGADFDGGGRAALPSTRPAEIAAGAAAAPPAPGAKVRTLDDNLNDLFKAKRYPELLTLAVPAAYAGNSNAQAVLGTLFLNGLGVPRDLERGFEWTRKAALQQHPAAQLLLSRLYRDGEGVKASAVESVKWLASSAENGYPRAQVELALLYLASTKGYHDPDRAMAWLGRATQRQGEFAPEPSAYYYLAKIFLGELRVAGVQADAKKALECLTKGAELGHPEAQRVLIVRSFYGGNGIEKNLEKAYTWAIVLSENEASSDWNYRMAARSALQNIGADLTQAQRAAAREEAERIMKARP